MNNRKLAGILAFVATQTCTTALAQAVVPFAPDSATVEKKRAMVERILTDPVIADTIAHGKNADAREKLASAKLLLERAQKLFQIGDVAAADRSLNDALRHISSARGLTSAAGILGNVEQTRYSELIQSIEVLEASYLRNVQQRSTWLAEVGDEDLKRVKILVDRAKALAVSGRFADANGVLVKAQRDMISSYNGLLGTAPMVIVYDLRFNTPDDEYKYEVERARDYEGLVPVAILEYKPARDSLTKIDQLVGESRSLTAEARSHAQKSQLQNAIMIQRGAIVKLQKALELAGVVVPQHIPN
jgi:tetratricopeptide (TPR) repeat protein